MQELVLFLLSKWIEVPALLLLGRWLLLAARRRGLRARPWLLALVLFWLTGEGVVGVCGYLLLSTPPPEMSLTETPPGLRLADWLLLYNLTLLGGGLGAGMVFYCLYHPTLWQRAHQAWQRFWFSPADPTLLGLIRLCCGLLVAYNLLVFTSDLQEFFGEYAWLPRQMRLEYIREFPVVLEPLLPQPPRLPKTPEEAERYEKAARAWGVDLRLVYLMRLPPPENDWQIEYVKQYLKKWGQLPPPPYPRDADEAEAWDAYRSRWGVDPRVAYTQGVRCASLWFHLSNPTVMMTLHIIFIFITLLFALGLATRLTAVLTWLIYLTYIHRNPLVLFGADTMMNIVLLYLAIGPSGAALSLDRVLARWWASARPRLLGRWRAFWGRWLGRTLPPVTPGLPPPVSPPPSVGANLALRLLQVHLCLIYLIAGLAKLRGQTWWNGTAVWYTLANFEFAPMQQDWYMAFLRTLARNTTLLQTFLTFGTGFTLFFEITYAFLIWRPATRWLMLGMALVLHGLIGLVMGLRTFALIMLIMNMAFLTPGEVHGLLSWGRRLFGRPPDRPGVKNSGRESAGPAPPAAGMKAASAGVLASS
jgi:hypothetical protein